MVQLSAAAEHLQSYLDRVDRAVSGTTYSALHDLIEHIDASHCLDTAAAVPPSLSTDTNQQSAASEPDECQLIFPSKTLELQALINSLYFRIDLQ